MFIPSATDAFASTASPVVLPIALPAISPSVSPASSPAPTPLPVAPPPAAGYSQEPIRHMLFGTLPAVQATIRLLHLRGYAEPNDWSEPLPTSRPNEVMAILTQRVRLAR